MRREGEGHGCIRCKASSLLPFRECLRGEDVEKPISRWFRKVLCQFVTNNMAGGSDSDSDVDAPNSRVGAGPSGSCFCSAKPLHIQAGRTDDAAVVTMEGMDLGGSSAGVLELEMSKTPPKSPMAAKEDDEFMEDALPLSGPPTHAVPAGDRGRGGSASKAKFKTRPIKSADKSGDSNPGLREMSRTCKPPRDYWRLLVGMLLPTMGGLGYEYARPP